MIGWPGFTGKNLNGGMVACVNLDINTNNHFQLKLDNEPGAFYAMRYDAIALYANEMHHLLYSSFCLPAHALSNPAYEEVVVEDVNEDDDDNDKFLTLAQALNKKCLLQKKQTTINPDSSMFGEDRMADCGIVDVYEPVADEEIVRLVRRKRGGRGGAALISTGRSFKMTAPVD
jgi:hypothetical protein